MSLSIVLPLKSSSDGFDSYADSETNEAIQQNLKMLLLTRPGEYVMDAEFGVGMINYLFYQQGSNVKSLISSRISQQAKKYMPYISISSINFDEEELEYNKLSISIEYMVADSELPQVFDLEVQI
jgi:phage baseplate assembly protein W